jgi:transcriptional regulator with XRE-family HTH domain
MATMMASVGATEIQSPLHEAPLETTAAPREVCRCAHCGLNQFRGTLDACRRCKKSLFPEPPKAAAPLALVAEPIVHHDAALAGKLQVSAAVRDLRKVRGLSQRQLAGRMGVPRTYISKIENGKAMPTLSSMDRLARALQVDISALLRDAPTRHQEETAMLSADPFLAEIAQYAAHLSATQKSIFLNHVRELAQGHTRKSA